MATRKVSFGASDLIAGLVARGMKQHEAEGFALNSGDESGYNPSAVGDHGNAYGLFQWNGPRMKALEAYAGSKGVALDNPDMQMDFLMTELGSSQSGAYAAVQATSNRADAAVAVLRQFERPAEEHAIRREAKYRGGAAPSGEFAGVVSDNSGATSSTPSEAPGGRMSITANYTGADLTDAANTPATSYITQREQDAAKAAAEANTPGYIEGFFRAFDETSTTNQLVRLYNKPEFAPDDNFQYDEALWKEVTAGLPEEYQKVFGDATSAPHARAIAAETMRSFEQDQKLASMGWTGVGLQLGASMLDPVAIAATAATEGALGPVIYGAKATKFMRFLKAGSVAAVVNTGLETVNIAQDPIGKWDGLAYAAAGGFLLGGTIGAFKRTDMDKELANPLKGFIKGIDNKAAGVTPAAPVSAPGSLSAAEVLNPTFDTPSNILADRFAGENIGAFQKIRIDIVGRLKSSENPILRKAAALLGEDALGNADGSVSLISVEERAHLKIKQTEVRFAKVHEEGLIEWAKENGYGIKRHYLPEVRAKFNAEVSLGVRDAMNANKHPAVQKVVAQVRAELADLHAFGKEYNIRGFDEFSANETYLPRSHSIQAIDDLFQKHGARTVHNLVAKSLVSGDKKWRALNKAKAQVFTALEYNDAKDIAAAYISSIRSRKYGMLDINQAMAGVDDDVLRAMLLDEGIDASRVNTLVDRMTAQIDSSADALGVTSSGKNTRVTLDRGRMTAAKRRLNLDETFIDTASGLKIADILENDVEFLLKGYTNSVVRAGYIEEAFSSFKVPNAEGALPTHAPSYMTVRKYISDKMLEDGVSENAGKAELGLLDTLYNAVAGKAQEPDAAWKAGIRRVRAFNFVRIAGQFGVAQLSEFGNILGNGGLRPLLQHNGAMGKIALIARRGQLGDDLTNELESILSTGTDVLRNNHGVRMESGDNTSFMAREQTSTGWQKVDFALNQGKRLTASVSGMSHVNVVLQRLNGRVLVQRFLDHAHGGRQINMKRFSALGVDGPMADKISDQIRKHMSTREGILGKQATHININQWDDIDAKNMFINSLDRWARRSIQENSIGAMPAFMTKEMGRSIFQFRSFMLGGYTKALLGGVQMRDWETYSTWATSMFFGGLAYVGQTHINSVGRSDREAWLGERLSSGSIAKAAFQRAGFSSILPTVIDTALWPFADGPVFNYRTSESPSNIILGNPSVALFDTAASAIKGGLSAASRSDYDYSQQDFRAASSLLFLQNAFGVRNVIAAIGGNLPRFSQ